MKTKLIILTITVLALTSCRKYEEGGKYFLANMSKKIAGTYHFTHYYIDGVDSVDYYFNNEYIAYLKFGIDETEIKNPLRIGFEHKSNDINMNFGINGGWFWDDKKKTKIQIGFGNLGYVGNVDTVLNGPFSEYSILIWDVLKIKDGELIIEADHNSKHYRTELKK